MSLAPQLGMGIPSYGRSLRSWFVGLALFASTLVGLPARAITPEQKSELTELKAGISRAAGLYKQKKFSECGEAVKSAQELLEKLAADADPPLRRALETEYKRLSNARDLLELEEVSLPELKKLSEMLPAPGAKPKGPTTSFTKQVAPLLVTHCGRCHVNNARGMFSMATYATLMKGPTAGIVITPGKPDASRLIEVVAGKEMPPNGNGIPPDDLALLTLWVKEGAKFDGDNPQANLTTFNSAAATEKPMITAERASGKETISFARVIAPILTEQCTSCHGDGQQLRGQFNLTTINGLLRGGDAGQAVIPGKPAESFLIKKLKGTGGGQRMPAGRDPLPDETIAKIEKWIEEGARFDGDEVGEHVRDVAAIAMARDATFDELSAERAKIAARNWRLGMAEVEPSRDETRSFLLLGDVGPNTLPEVGQRAEAIAPKVASMLHAGDTPLLKGRMTLFVFKQRYNYAEFGQMVERRELPASLRGHWNYNIIDAYGALIAPRDNEYSLDSILGQQIAGTYIASLGKLPRWFSEGTSRVIAARLAPKDARVREWDERLPEALVLLTKPEDLLAGKLPPEEAEVVYYSFVRFLMKRGPNFDGLLASLRKGAPFDQAFVKAFGAPPVAAVPAWIADARRDAARASSKPRKGGNKSSADRDSSR